MIVVIKHDGKYLAKHYLSSNDGLSGLNAELYKLLYRVQILLNTATITYEIE